MKLQTLKEAKYAHGKTVERVLKFFKLERMHYSPSGEEEPLYAVKPDYFAQLGKYSVNNISFGESFEGKFVWVNSSKSYLLDHFLEKIKIFKKSQVL